MYKPRVQQRQPVPERPIDRGVDRIGERMPNEQYQRQEPKVAATKKANMQWQRIEKKTPQQEQKQASSSSEPDYQ
jgi:hypothetical protein